MEFKGPEVTEGVYWRAVGARPVGATVITAQYEGTKVGFLGLSFAHVSARPPIVLVSVSRSTTALATILASKAFAVSELPDGAEAVARAFGGGTPNQDRFSDRDWETLVSGAPIYPNAAVAFDCKLHRTIEEGDTILVLGRVEGIRVGHPSGVTVAYRGSYENLFLPR